MRKFFWGNFRNFENRVKNETIKNVILSVRLLADVSKGDNENIIYSLPHFDTAQAFRSKSLKIAHSDGYRNSMTALF